MKKNKKLIMALCFCLGAIMLTTTAFADIASKSGYEQFKDAIKLTSQKASESFNSYTIELTATLKDNDKLIMSADNVNKFDFVNNRSETTTSTEFTNGNKTGFFTYRDSEGIINKSSNDDTYYVSKIKGNTIEHQSDVFKDDKAKDIEKIIDAVVGNLKEYVVVNDNSDGTKEFSGSLNEAQIPALMNAVASFIFKQAMPNSSPVISRKIPGYYAKVGEEQLAIPQMAEDVYIKSVKGKATTNKDGTIESIFATGILSGKDKSGTSHDLTLEALFTLTNIDSTSITKPDLTGKKVEKTAGIKIDDATISKKYIGKYKNDIVIEKDDQYVKIGERFVEITKIDGSTLTGKYYEQYKKGYKDYKSKIDSFNFNASASHPYNVQFQYKDSSGSTHNGNLGIEAMTGNIYFNIDYKGAPIDSRFSRVFD